MTYEEAITKRPQIEAAVAEALAELSPDVVQIRYGIALDWTDEWAIFFHAFLSDEAAKDTRELAPRIVRTVTDKLDLRTLDLFPYFDFRDRSELAKLNEPAWA